MYEFTKYRSQKEQTRCRYIFDVDGNAWSGHFRWLCDLISKSTIYPEWFVTPISSSPMAVDVSPPSPTMNILSAQRDRCLSWEAKTLPLLKNPRSAKGALSAYSVDRLTLYLTKQQLESAAAPFLACSSMFDIPFQHSCYFLSINVQNDMARERLPFVYVAGPSAELLLKSAER
ncbi:uncharacterized protein ARMOST_02641 [Armillaria ostoyae]|uniref:Uncharacterized protein n=1 Tax=Armillaria ostoyae TaxID=47428 RepID=A0A284QS87_ARMOS|nr:uncharacterized protein ARMOST_02641 [Armillaria ostoyae]